MYQRRSNDFYPTPSERLRSASRWAYRGWGLICHELRSIRAGDCAPRRSLEPFGVDVRLTDLYPDKYPGVDGYVTSQSLDVSDPEHLTQCIEAPYSIKVLSGLSVCDSNLNRVQGLDHGGRVSVERSAMGSHWPAVAQKPGLGAKDRRPAGHQRHRPRSEDRLSLAGLPFLDGDARGRESAWLYERFSAADGDELYERYLRLFDKINGTDLADEVQHGGSTSA